MLVCDVNVCLCYCLEFNIFFCVVFFVVDWCMLCVVYLF